MGKDLVSIYRASQKIENHKLILGAAEEVMYYVNQSGIDTSSSPYSIYFDFDRAALKTSISATAVCSMTEWNGKVLKSPRTINPGVNVIEADCSSFKLVSTGATVIEVTTK